MISYAKYIRLNGFTMIETLVAIMLVGIAVVSLIAASGSLTRINAAGVELSTAEFLIEQIREMTDLLPAKDPQTSGTFGPEEATYAQYDDVDDFHNFNSSSLGAPISSDGLSLDDFSAYSQKVTVEHIMQNDFTAVDPTNTSDFMRVTVKIFLNGNEISSASWLRTRY